MRFYKIQSSVKGIEYALTDEDKDSRELTRSFGFRSMVKAKTEEFNARLGCTAHMSISRITMQDVVICTLVQEELDIADACIMYLKDIGIRIGAPDVSEITFNTYGSLLRDAHRSDFVQSDDEVHESFGLNEVERPFCSRAFTETIWEPMTAKAIDQECRRLLTSASLRAEMERIRLPKQQECAPGHPVHYVIQTDDDETRSKTSTILINQLVKNKRVRNQRICSLDCTAERELSKRLLETIFDMNRGGTIVIPLLKCNGFSSDRMDRSFDVIERLCMQIKMHRNDVLTVVLLPRDCTQLRKYLHEQLGSMSFVEIAEDPADEKRAKRVLSMMAKDSGISTDDGLFSQIDSGESYLAGELRIIFEEWFSKKLRGEVYPQYADFEMVGAKDAKKQDKGNAYEELMAMVGLDEAKKTICQLIDFHRMQRFLAARDLARQRPSCHMLFTGNPGTAKTTVARIFARIMRENELLTSGHIIEVGRGDLVGKFVGHTAPRVKEIFKRAKGGVLFIDEAYALIDDKEGMYGDEAINTIVQEMENNRDDMVVIFAGYPDKMEHFLQRNPGLRSRIPFHIDFPDYDAGQLCEIASLICDGKGMRLGDGALDKLKGIFGARCHEKDFGNGRYVRSVVEKAMLAQATRLASSQFESLKKAELITILDEDVELPENKANSRHIGFCA